MTARDFADFCGARRHGPSRWMMRCPVSSHVDRTASVSITEGRDGRILVHDFAGCELNAILKALGLTIRDLYDGPPPSPEQMAITARERDARSAQQRQERAQERNAWDKVLKLNSIVNALGAKLYRMPDSAPEGHALTQLFHQACDRLHDAETMADMKGPAANGPQRKDVA